MKKTKVKKEKGPKQSIKEILRKTSLHEETSEKPHLKKFSMTLVVEGHMLDKDTPISAESLTAFFEMQYSCPKGMKVHVSEAHEIVPPVVVASEPSEPPPAAARAPEPAGN